MTKTPPGMDFLFLVHGIFRNILLFMGYQKSPPPRTMKCHRTLSTTLRHTWPREKKAAAIHQTYGETTKDLRQMVVIWGEPQWDSRWAPHLGVSGCLYPCYSSLYPQYICSIMEQFSVVHINVYIMDLWECIIQSYPKYTCQCMSQILWLLNIH